MKRRILFGENSWKWRAMSYTQNKSFTPFDSFINKLVQYLAITKKFNRIELDYLPIVYQNDLVKISASYFLSYFPAGHLQKSFLSVSSC